MLHEEISYLEERKLVKRWPGPWPALTNLVFTLIIFGITWWERWPLKIGQSVKVGCTSQIRSDTHEYHTTQTLFSRVQG